MDPRSRTIHTAVCEITQKSESLSPDLIAQAYVDMGHVDRLLNSNNQYVDGRRGTGKTHLFSYLCEHIRANTNGQSDTAIYIDMRNTEVESGPHLGDARAKARSLFRELLRRIAIELKNIAEKDLFQNSIPVQRDDWEQHIARKTADILRALWEAIEVGEYREDIPRQQVSKDITHQSHGIEGSASLGASPAPKFSLIGTLSTSWNKGSETTEQSEGRYTIPYAKISALIADFLDANNLDRIFILLDEWSSISVEAQPHVAEHLKRSLFPSNRITLKIACIPFQRSFHATEGATIVGFERQGDIYPALDLDEELVYVRNPDSTLKNFSQLIHNHILFHLPQTAHNIMPADARDTVRRIITDAAHERLLKYSHGNPRDYLSLFRKSYLKWHPQTLDRITSTIVDSAAKELGAEKIEGIRENSRAHMLLKNITQSVLHEKQLSALGKRLAYVQ